jgi:hypothetical protein
MVQIHPVRPIEGPMKLNSLLNALGRCVSEAGSEQSTNFRWWIQELRVIASRWDLNHPPTAVTAVGGISKFSGTWQKESWTRDRTTTDHRLYADQKIDG